MSFELIDHTADIGIQAEGEDLEEAFEEAGRAMFSIITDLEGIDQEESYDIEVTGTENESLLVNFLSELIYIFEVERLLFSDFELEIEENKGLKLTGKGKGERIDLDKHELDTAVKAVSYHEIMVDPAGKVRVILDL